MLNLAVNGYTEQEVINQLHGVTGSREIKFRYDLLNRYGIKIGELTAHSGNRITMNSEAKIKRTAMFEINEDEAQDVDWLNDRIRPVFLLKMPDGGYAEWPLGVFMPSSPGRTNTNRKMKREIEAYDESLILSEDRFDNRYYIAAGTTYTSAIKTIINSAGIWKVNIISNSSTITTGKEFEIGTTKLEAVNQLLAEINYTTIWVDENGYFTAKPYVLPTLKGVEYTYKNNEISVIHEECIEEIDYFSVPNKWIRVVSNPEQASLVSVYTNSLPTSVTSTVNRGRTIADYDTVDDIADQDTLDAYTRRVAYEASQIYSVFTFDTALMPHHSFYNCLFLAHTDFDIANKYMEYAWEMDLQAGGKMNHSCRRVIVV